MNTLFQLPLMYLQLHLLIVLDVSSQDTSPFGLAFNNDGTKMFVTGVSSNADVYEYALSTGFDVSTASYVDNLDISSQGTNIKSIVFNNDGTKMFISASYNAGARVNEYTLSTGFDLSSTVSFVDGLDISSKAQTPFGIVFNNEGTKLFVVDQNGDDVNEYTLSTGFDVSTASFTGSFDVSSQDSNHSGIAFNNDGTKMFTIGYQNEAVHEYILYYTFQPSECFW